MKPNTLNSEAVEYLQERLVDEYKAEKHYRGCYNYCENNGFSIAAKFFLAEADTEMNHVNKLMAYATKWNVMLNLPEIPEAKQPKSLTECIESSYKIEYALLEDYMEDAKECFEMGDLTTFALMQTFISIQNDAVGEFSDKLNMLALFDKTNPNWIWQFEKKLFEGQPEIVG
jgi:ferritin